MHFFSIYRLLYHFQYSCAENKLCFEKLEMYTFSSIHKEHIIFSNSLTDRSVFLHQIECCKIQFTSIKLNLVLSKQKLIVDKYSRYRQAESIRLKFVSGYHISLILCIQDHPNYQNIQNMACPPYRCQTKEFSGD